MVRFQRDIARSLDRPIVRLYKCHMHHDTDPQMSEVATLLTLREAGIYLGVHDETIRRWIKAGRLDAKRVGVGQHYRVRREDLDALVKAA